MGNTKLQSSLILLAALAAAACASRKVDTENTYRSGGEATVLEEEIGSSLLERQLEIRAPLHKRDDAGFLSCQFELHNKQKSQIEMEWTVSWFDESGMKIDTNEHWRPQVLGGMAFETLKIVAPTPAAARWKLKVRESSAIQ